MSGGFAGFVKFKYGIKLFLEISGFVLFYYILKYFTSSIRERFPKVSRTVEIIGMNPDGVPCKILGVFKDP